MIVHILYAARNFYVCILHIIIKIKNYFFLKLKLDLKLKNEMLEIYDSDEEGEDENIN